MYGMETHMSRGPGKRQAAIEAVMTDGYDDIFTLEDLALVAFPGLNRLEKKHAVATARAAKAACDRRCWGWGNRQAVGRGLVFFNKRSVRSYALFQLRCDYTFGLSTTDELRADLDGSGTRSGRFQEQREDMQLGGAWYADVMRFIADFDQDEIALAAAADADYASMDRVLSAIRQAIKDRPENFPALYPDGIPERN